MINYLLPLGDCVKNARLELGLTQTQVAELVGIDSQTILHIENYRSNPKMEVMFPLIRALHIDPRDIYYPELEETQEARTELDMLLADCSEEQIRAILPVIRASLDILKAKDGIAVK